MKCHRTTPRSCPYCHASLPEGETVCVCGTSVPVWSAELIRQGKDNPMRRTSEPQGVDNLLPLKRAQAQAAREARRDARYKRTKGKR